MEFAVDSSEDIFVFRLWCSTSFVQEAGTCRGRGDVIQFHRKLPQLISVKSN